MANIDTTINYMQVNSDVNASIEDISSWDGTSRLTDLATQFAGGGYLIIFTSELTLSQGQEKSFSLKLIVSPHIPIKSNIAIPPMQFLSTDNTAYDILMPNCSVFVANK